MKICLSYDGIFKYMNKEIFKLIKNYQHINIMCFLTLQKKTLLQH